MIIDPFNWVGKVFLFWLVMQFLGLFVLLGTLNSAGLISRDQMGALFWQLSVLLTTLMLITQVIGAKRRQE